MDNTKKLFYRTGIAFHVIATFYLSALIWKTYVWWKWLNQLQEALDMNNSGLL